MVADQDAGRVLRETVPAPVGYRLAEEVGPETAAVFPVRPVKVGEEERFGMWTLDLVSGHTIALLDTGLRGGQGNPERSEIEGWMATWRAQGTKLARQIAENCVKPTAGNISMCRALAEKLRDINALLHWAADELGVAFEAFPVPPML